MKTNTCIIVYQGKGDILPGCLFGYGVGGEGNDICVQCAYAIYIYIQWKIPGIVRISRDWQLRVQNRVILMGSVLRGELVFL